MARRIILEMMSKTVQLAVLGLLAIKAQPMKGKYKMMKDSSSMSKKKYNCTNVTQSERNGRTKDGMT